MELVSCFDFLHFFVYFGNLNFLLYPRIFLGDRMTFLSNKNFEVWSREKGRNKKNKTVLFQPKSKNKKKEILNISNGILAE